MVFANVREQSIAFCKSHVPIIVVGLAWVALLACPPSRPLALSVFGLVAYYALCWLAFRRTAASDALRRAWYGNKVLIVAVTFVFTVVVGFYLSRYFWLPTWDSIGYWGKTLNFNAFLWDQPKNAVVGAIRSVGVDDYNDMLCWVMSLPVHLLPSWAGASFAILLFGHIPVALALSSVVASLSLGTRSQSKAFVVVYMAALTWPLMLRPTLVGYFDEVACLALVCSLAALTDSGLPSAPLRGIPAGLCLCATIVLRRWFVYAAVGAAVFVVLLWLARGLFGKRGAFEVKGVLAAAGCCVVAVLLPMLTVFLGLTKRSLEGGYTTAYQSWKLYDGYIGSVTEAIRAIGWLPLALGIACCIVLVVRNARQKRPAEDAAIALPCCLGGIVPTVLLFWSTQDFSPQHYYVIAFLLFIAMVAPVAGLFGNAAKPTRTYAWAGYAFSAVMVLAFAYGLSSLPAGDLGNLGFPLGRPIGPPVRHEDVEQRYQLVDWLDEHATSNDTVYFAVASGTLNSSIVDSVMMSRGFTTVPFGVESADVDSRDGFNTSFFDARYVVVSNPPSIHLAPEDEQVVTRISEGIGNPRDCIGKHYRLCTSFDVGGNVVVEVYERTSDYTVDDIGELMRHFDKAYPNSPELFHDRFVEYLGRT